MFNFKCCSTIGNYLTYLMLVGFTKIELWFSIICHLHTLKAHFCGMKTNAAISTKLSQWPHLRQNLHR